MQTAQHSLTRSLLSRYGLWVWTSPGWEDVWSPTPHLRGECCSSTGMRWYWRGRTAIVHHIAWHPLHQVQWCRNIVLIVRSSQQSARGFKTDPAWSSVLLTKHGATKAGACLLLLMRPELWASKCGSQQREESGLRGLVTGLEKYTSVLVVTDKAKQLCVTESQEVDLKIKSRRLGKQGG